MNHKKYVNKRAQSSLELLITLSFGLVILIPVVVFAFIQISNSNSTLSSTESQQVASKLTAVATSVGSQGYPAKEVVVVQMPPGVNRIYVGNLQDTVGHEIVFNVTTSAGPSYVTSYAPLNISGNLGSVTGTATYLLNVSAQNHCPSDPSVSCVYITEQQSS